MRGRHVERKVKCEFIGHFGMTFGNVSSRHLALAGRGVVIVDGVLDNDVEYLGEILVEPG